MPNFVFDGEVLPGTKVDGPASILPPNQVVTAAEFNEMNKALADIRTLLNGLIDVSALTAVATFVAVSAGGRTYFELNDPLNGNQITYLYVAPDGTFKVSLNPPP
jgi:hypothetical protein